MSYFAGIDIGSTMSKAVIYSDKVIASVVGPTGPEHRVLANEVMEKALDLAGIPFSSITYVVSTGYGRINVPFADKQITEIGCHAKGVFHLFPNTGTIIDIGGQDSKAITINQKGKITDFIMNDKCAAGSGRFVEIIADVLGLRLEEMGDISIQSKDPVTISNICTIYAQQEVAESLAKGVGIPDLVAGIHKSLADRVAAMANRLKIRKDIVLTGGGAKNKGLLHALSINLGHEIFIPPDPLITGALGAALSGKEIAEKSVENHTPLEIKERKLEKVKII